MMTPAEIKDHAKKERIKAWIYFGIEAELEIVEHQQEIANLGAHKAEDLDYHKREMAILQKKIELVNSRLLDFGAAE